MDQFNVLCQLHVLCCVDMSTSYDYYYYVTFLRKNFFMRLRHIFQELKNRIMGEKIIEPIVFIRALVDDCMHGRLAFPQVERHVSSLDSSIKWIQ